jgi:hypothetical protein
MASLSSDKRKQIALITGVAALAGAAYAIHRSVTKRAARLAAAKVLFQPITQHRINQSTHCILCNIIHRHQYGCITGCLLALKPIGDEGITNIGVNMWWLW